MNLGSEVLIGRASECQIMLDSPLVSRLHAVLTEDRLTDQNSANGTYVDGVRIQQTRLLEGSRITIGPYHLKFQDGELKFVGRGLTVTCEKLTYVPRGTDLKILENLDLEIKPGTFLALIGTSGAGKSTLMKLMAGLLEPSTGRVLFNGRPRQSQEFRRSAGWVPQEEIVHGRLTVFQALGYSALLRLPEQTTQEEIQRRVRYAAEQVSLSHRLNIPILRLSGGERKRVALAAEELGDPDVFFLDEPTSGLDPGLEKEIMLSLQDLARRGRTVILITHATANILLCDKVLFLAPGGHPVYFGSPKEALTHFQTEDFAEIYRKLTDPSWVAGPGMVLSEKTRTILGKTVSTPEVSTDQPCDSTRPKGISAFRQLRLLLQRDLTVTLADRSYMALLLLQAPVIGLVLGKLFNPKTFSLQQTLDSQGRYPLMEAPTLLFMLIVSAIFFGAINSCRELVKERSIYRREQLLGVRPDVYLGSKILMQGGKGAFSVTVLTLVVTALIPFPWSDTETFQAVVLLWCAYMGGVGLGLILSALVGTAEQATTLVTVVLILQLVMSGAFVKPEAMEFPLSVVSIFAISRWSFAGLCHLSRINERFAEIPLPFVTADYYIPLNELYAVLWPLLALHLALPLLFLYLRKDSH